MQRSVSRNRREVTFLSRMALLHQGPLSLLPPWGGGKGSGQAAVKGPQLRLPYSSPTPSLYSPATSSLPQPLLPGRWQQVPGG